MADAVHTRRAILRAIPSITAAATLPACVAVAAASAESPQDRAMRLAEEFAEALNEYGGGFFHALVYPAASKTPGTVFVNSAAQRRHDAEVVKWRQAARAFRDAHRRQRELLKPFEAAGLSDVEGNYTPEYLTYREASFVTLDAESALKRIAIGEPVLATY